MAGASDSAMRELCAEQGASFGVSEMVSAKALSLDDRNSFLLTKRSEKEKIYGIQLFGSEPGVMAEAAKRLLVAKPDFIDINMGCPVPKIVKTGAGSALMADPDKAAAVVKAVVDAVPLPVTIKIRKGFGGAENAVEVAQKAVAAGAAAVAVHGRTREQYYIPGVDWEIIKQVKQAVEVPVIGNGDVTSAAGALEMLAATGCDQVMIGRAAMGNPWIFREIKAALAGQPIPAAPPVSERMRTMLHHVYRLCEQHGEYAAMRIARTQAAAYLRGLSGAAELRRQAGELANYTDAERLAQRALYLQKKAKKEAENVKPF